MVRFAKQLLLSWIANAIVLAIVTVVLSGVTSDEAGDLISVPRGTLHWFDLCADRRIRAIRLFQDSSGWTPHYTDSGVDANFQPVCFGSTYIQDSTRTTA